MATKPLALDDTMIRQLVLLHRLRWATAKQLAAVILPGRPLNKTQQRLKRLRDHGLVEVLPWGNGHGGRKPWIYRLTSKGHRAATGDGWAEADYWRADGPERFCIPERSRFRKEAWPDVSYREHHLRAVTWLLSLRRALDAAATRRGVTFEFRLDTERGIRETTMYDAAQRRQMPIPGASINWSYVINGIAVPDRGEVRSIRPDAILALDGRTEAGRHLGLDLLIEMDNTGRPAGNLDKFSKYDSFFVDWGDRAARDRGRNRLAYVLFVVHRGRLESFAAAAHRQMTGRRVSRGDVRSASPTRERFLFCQWEAVTNLLTYNKMLVEVCSELGTSYVPGSLRAYRLPADCSEPFALRETCIPPFHGGPS